MSAYDLALAEALELAKTSHPIAEVLHDRLVYVCDDLPLLAFVAASNASHEQMAFAILEQAAIARVQQQTALAELNIQRLQDLPAQGGLQ